MPPEKYKVSGAMFDVRPVDKTGHVDFTKISGISAVVDLRSSTEKEENVEIKKESIAPTPAVRLAEQSVVKKQVRVDKRRDVIQELETVLSKDLNPHAELASIGAEIKKHSLDLRPRLRPILSRPILTQVQDEPDLPQPEEAVPETPTQQDQEFNRIISEIMKPPAPESEVSQAEKPEPVTPAMIFEQPATAELGTWLDDLKTGKQVIAVSRQEALKKRKIFQSKWAKKFAIGIAVLLVAIVSVKYGLDLKARVMKNGSTAVQNLEDAKDKLKSLDFTGASGSFAEAYDEFSKANDSLSFMGASIGSLLGDLPGGGKIKSASNLVEAGKLLADAGKAMSQSIDAISKTSLILNPLGSSQGSMGSIFSSLKQSLSVSDKNLKQADKLLADLDTSLIPPDKKQSFDEFTAKLPLFEKLVSDGLSYSGFLENLVGLKGSKKYLLLFQNPAELRATGGFPGTYGVVSFQDGSLSNFMVDDIYNPDGQLKENIVPPVPLQHITPTWAMRDANWFVDFPTSAKKIMSFLKKETSQDVDGVITISPDIVSQILEVVGPVEMPEYNMTIDSKNFATAIQNEVEYGKNRVQPKKILVDMAPRLLKKIYSADSDQWMAIFNIFVSSVDRKDILMYFRDLTLQSFAYDNGFTGQVKNGDFDYLMVNFTNVKGSKTDSVIDNSLKVSTDFSDKGIKHTATITRKHNGGKSQFGFYNRQSPTWVRVLVPEGSELLSINGNSKPDFKPLVNYSKGFKRDEDLAKLESSVYEDSSRGVEISKESGKTVFGFWMIVDPGNTGTVELEYSIPLKFAKSDYEFMIQKQPGMHVNDFELDFTKPADTQITESSPVLNKVGENYILNQQFEKDLDLKMKFN